MKKNVIKLGVIVTALLGVMACGTKNANESATNAETSEEIELKGFLVGGMYFMQGFGGVDAVESMVSPNGTEKDDLVKSYREIFILPFKPEQASDIKSTLSGDWEINSKEDLVKTLDNLKTKNDTANPHKAWDYARLVNNACMGYAAGYLTDAEAKKYVADVLIIAQNQFKTWSDYLKDYNEGRKTWNPESSDAAEYDKVTADMTKNSNGIYQLLPLNK